MVTRQHFSADLVVWAVFLVACTVRADFSVPICVPGFLSTGANTVDIFGIGTGLTVRPHCTQLREPLMEAEVEPSLQPTLQWRNISERNYFWGYTCEGEGVSVSRNLSTTLPVGLLGWTLSPHGSQGSKAASLPLGTECVFFGCYVYTIRQSISLGVFNETRYIFDVSNTTCVIDLDECADGTADCDQECTDIRNGTVDSYQCDCSRGYTLSEDLHNCTDVDECKTGENNCDQICTADGGWFNCSCRYGYTLGEDGHTCNDINECESNGTILCESETTGRVCTNTPGSYQCHCQDGFEFSQNDTMCMDIDECEVHSNGSSPCLNNCVNTVGGYNCTCYTWYLELGTDLCIARNVCSELNSSCGAHSSCVNYPDSVEGYKCVCDSGYRQNGGTCTFKALVHLIWVFTILFVALTIALLISVFLLRHKYLKNKNDIMKRYSVLFKYQMKKEEVDPSFNPVPFAPARKVSYTFSLVSTLESYEYPLTPTLLEPDDTRSIESGYDSNFCFSGEQLMVCADQDSSKRELSPIIEGNEDSLSVGKTTKEVETQPSVVVPEVNKEMVKGYLTVEETNPAFLAMEGNSGSVYVDDSDVFTCLPVTAGETLPGGLTDVNSGAETKTEDCAEIDRTSADAQTADSGAYVDSSHASLAGAVRERVEGPQTTSEGSSLHHAWTIASGPSAANDGYIPSNFSTTSSGYGSEEGNSSGFSYKSRLTSASSYITDSSLPTSGCYVPTSVSSPSSGYASESGVNKRGSLASQLSCDTPHMPPIGSDGCWTHSQYVNKGSSNSLAQTGREVSDPPPLSTGEPLQSHSHQQLCSKSSTASGSYVDSVFPDCTTDVEHVSSSPDPLNATGSSERGAIVASSSGYIPYPSTEQTNNSSCLQQTIERCRNSGRVDLQATTTSDESGDFSCCCSHTQWCSCDPQLFPTTEIIHSALDPTSKPTLQNNISPISEGLLSSRDCVGDGYVVDPTPFSLSNSGTNISTVRVSSV